jgi:hypothetical protein
MILHLIGVLAIGNAYARRDLSLAALAPNEPFILNLESDPPALEPPQTPRQLIEDVRPSEEEPVPTDLISDVNSKAMDQELLEGTDPGPHPDERGDFDTMAAPPVPPAPKEEKAQPAPPQPAERPAQAPTPPPGQRSETAREPKPAPRPEADPLADRVAAQPQETPPEETPGVERMQIARANPPPRPEPAPPRQSKGRLHDKVLEKGIMNYEAMQDDIAPYMKEVRRRVEVKWIELLVTRYTGATQTKAVVDCKISPQGELLSVEIVKATDRVFGGMCVEALKRAAPFPPFPFQVPDMFREKNLEIQWTFNFL